MTFDEFRKKRRDAKGYANMLCSPLFLWLAWETRMDPVLCLAFLVFGLLWGGLGILILYVKYLEWSERRGR